MRSRQDAPKVLSSGGNPLYILGSGITGLLLGYLTNSPVYGDILGGQLTGMTKGPRILEQDHQTEELVRNLGVESPPKIFNVGYRRSSTILRSVTHADTVNYYQKTRGSEAEMPQSIMSGGKSEILGWDLNEIELVRRLSKQVTYIPTRVNEVDFLTNSVATRNLISGRLGILPLDECVSTLNLKVLLRLMAQSPREIFYLYPDEHGNIRKSIQGMDTLDLGAHDTTFISVDNDYQTPPIPGALSYVYCVDPEDPINRITWIGEQGLCFECRGDKFEEAVAVIEKLGYQIDNVETIRFCQLKQSHNILEIGLDREGFLGQRLKLCGRFARWTHNFKINHVFKEAALYAKQVGY